MRWAYAGIVVGLSALLLLAGCSTSRSTDRSTARFRDHTETLERTFAVTARMDSTRLGIRIELSSGTAVWRFVDPTGAIRGEGGSTDGRRVERSFDPIVGDWTFTLSLEQATGSYEIDWVGRW